MDIPLLLHDEAFSLVSNKGHWRSAWKVDTAIAEAHGNLRQPPNATEPSEDDNETTAAAGENRNVVIKSLK